tara:strand:+ start:12779 stop:14989 length:2211 start_codon:yes stop_codon:yes gene_type:complete
MYTKYLLAISSLLLTFHSSKVKAQGTTQPNLIIFLTDEHNLRTIGCYRETMSDEQAFQWGVNTFVTTPNIDKLATEGALCTQYYAASPVCTPSRASLISGFYPIATGSDKNDLPMLDNIVTFAETLKQNGYATSYVGKWHLDGDAKPGFAPSRKFGFADNRYMFNRGHWKGFTGRNETFTYLGDFNPASNSYSFDTNTATDESFSTDYLFNRSLEIIERDKNEPFCLLLSIPDPHGNDKVRAPYDTMYTHMNFENPRTLHQEDGTLPNWNTQDGNLTINQNNMAQYWGMVKCIDDNIGRVLDYLETTELDKNTIVIFTSDHGDLLGEHGKLNKGLPYETSAKIPFIIRYPEKIKAGKKIHTAFTNVDFTPTILNLMEATGLESEYHGIDSSEAFLNDASEVDETRITYITNAANKWVAAVDGRHKLVLSPSDSPWLFDLQEDPDELINFYADENHATIANTLEATLKEMLKTYEDPIYPLLFNEIELPYSEDYEAFDLGTDLTKTTQAYEETINSGQTGSFSVVTGGNTTQVALATADGKNHTIQTPKFNCKPITKYSVSFDLQATNGKISPKIKISNDGYIFDNYDISNVDLSTRKGSVDHSKDQLVLENNIPTRATLSFTATEDMSYFKVQWYQFGANSFELDNLEIKEETIASSNSIEKHKIMMSPNPVIGYITITSEIKIEKIFVIDLNGRHIALLLENNNRANLSSLAPGVYICVIQFKNKTEQNLKIIKK